jgi:hypothetical protein
MNNLHRELAPISDVAWADIEEETTRTLKRYLAGRRVVDVHGPSGVISPPSAPATSGRSRRRVRASSRSSARSRQWLSYGFRSSSIVSRLTTWSGVRTEAAVVLAPPGSE